MRFTFRQLEYFVAVGETGGVTAASERINISPPTISAAISQLEAEFGFQLFVRQHAQGLSLTPAGERFLMEAKALLAQAGELGGLAEELSEKVSGPLKVGCLVTIAAMVVPELCHGFMERHEAVRVDVSEDHQAELLEKLRRAEIAVALTYDLQLPEDIAFEPLVELPPYALFAADHPLAQEKRLALSRLAEEPLVLLDLPLSREYFMSLFFQDRLRPTIYSSSAHLEVIRTLVANGYGYSLLNVRPKNMRALDGKPLASVPLTADYRAMVMGLASLRRYRKPRAVEAFEDYCRERISGRVVPGMAPPPG